MVFLQNCCDGLRTKFLMQVTQGLAIGNLSPVIKSPYIYPPLLLCFSYWQSFSCGKCFCITLLQNLPSGLDWTGISCNKFSLTRPLGQVSLVVAMSICPSVCLSVKKVLIGDCAQTVRVFVFCCKIVW